MVSSQWKIIHRKCPHRRRYFSQVSGIINSQDVQNYAAKHEDLARQSLVVPVPNSCYHSQDISREMITKNLHNYVRWRKWDEQYLSNPYTFAMISHVLTFPLTLASYNSDIINNRRGNVIRLCCVGARSEAYLPDHFWREFLYFCNVADRAFSSSPSTTPIQWHISFIGHDLPATLKSRNISLDQDASKVDGISMQHSSIQMTFHSGLLHEHIKHLYKKDHPSITEESIQSLWDAFVLFNPGIGHPNLISSWDPTLRFILQTGKKVLLTSHSDFDSHRDGEILQEHLGKDVEYHSNPFASLLAYDDPFPPKEGVRHVVRPNHSVCWID